jgi:DNA-binding transcriptional MerR regulator
MYSSKETSEMTGVSVRQLILLCERNAIIPIKDASGQGTQRIYSDANLAQIRIAKKLLECQVSIRTIGKILNSGYPCLIRKVDDYHRIFCLLTQYSTGN